MSIITIARQNGSGGQELATALAENIGGTLLTTKKIEAMIGRYGLPAFDFERFNEKAPSLGDYFKTGSQTYHLFTRMAICEEALKSPHLVILGQGSQEILKKISGVFKTLVVAEEEARVARVMKRRDIREKEARQRIKMIETSRKKYHSFFFDVDWMSPLEYDMVINSTNLSKDQVVEMICHAALLGPSERSQQNQELEDYLVAGRVMAEVIFKQKLPVQYFSVAADRGNVTLKGIVSSLDVVPALKDAVLAIDGVSEVTPDFTLYNAISPYPGIIDG